MAYTVQAVRHEVERLSDDEFAALVKQFDALQTLEEKVRFVLFRSTGGEGLITAVTREIGGRLNSYGLSIQRAAEADRIALIAHRFLKAAMVDHYKDTFPSRLQRCASDRERINLVEAEIKEQTNFLQAGGKEIKEYGLGYKFEKLKRDDLFEWCYVDLSGVMKHNSTFHRTVHWCASGAAVYGIEMYLTDLLEELKPTPSAPVKKQKRRPSKEDYRLTDFFDAGMDERFLAVEKKITGEVETWRSHQRGSLIACAGFLEAVFQKKWFWAVKPGTASVNNDAIRDFAMWRYGLDITVQLTPMKKRQREAQRDRFLKRPIW